MKRNIKTLCLLAMLAIISTSTVYSQLGVQAGYVHSKFRTDAPLFPLGEDGYNGFEIGPTYDFQIQGGVYMNFGLLYSFAASTSPVGVVDVDNKAHFLNLPVRVGYKYPINNSFRVFGYAGPNFTFGLAGETTGEIIGFDVDGKWYGENSDFKRFDIKLGLGIGVEYRNLQLKAGYDWGLINSLDSSDYYARRNQFNISFVYLFGLGR